VGGGDGEMSDVEEGDCEGEGLGLDEAEDQLAMDSYDVSDSVLLSMQVSTLCVVLHVCDIDLCV